MPTAGDDVYRSYTNSLIVNGALEALKGKSHWLFSCHGKFDWSDPRESGLQLAGDETLTLGALLSRGRAPSAGCDQRNAMRAVARSRSRFKPRVRTTTS